MCLQKVAIANRMKKIGALSLVITEPCSVAHQLPHHGDLGMVLGGTWNLQLLGQSALIWSAGAFQQHSLMPGFPSSPGEVSSFAVPSHCSCWRRRELQSMVRVLVVDATNGFSLTDTSRLPKTLSLSSSQTMRLLYKSQFFVSLIIFICTFGLQGKVASSFQTFLCCHRNLCSALNGNELLECYIPCFEAFFFFKKKKH